MTDRARIKRTIKDLSHPLTNAVVVEKGEMACLDTSTGLLTKGGTSTTLVSIGYFSDAGTGDGTTPFRVDLFEEIAMQAWDNDSAPNDVQAAHVGSQVYIKDERTVSTSSGGGTRSIAGRVIKIDSLDGVFIQQGLAVTGPTGASGSALASGGVATRAALKAVAAASRFDGMLVLVRTDGSLWRFVAASSQAADGADELVLVPDAGTGRWVRADKAAVLKLPIAAATADGADLLLVPAGMTLRLTGFPFWEIDTAFTGGTSSAIGASTTVTGYETKGDLIGGAAGDVEAGLTAGIRPGTIGGELGDLTGFHELLLVAGAAIEFDRIVDAFTGGAGFICVPVAISTDN